MRVQNRLAGASDFMLQEICLYLLEFEAQGTLRMYIRSIIVPFQIFNHHNNLVVSVIDSKYNFSTMPFPFLISS